MEKDTVKAESKYVYVDSSDAPGKPQGTGLLETAYDDAKRWLGATSEVVHGDGWNEATHGEHPSARVDTGI